ncbi:MAG: alpha/beta hydrolase-fold protein [Pseudomonadota bacterium]|nr:alpha/beta hydrolase-fold protein [Pseudomonadota bacterium]
MNLQNLCGAGALVAGWAVTGHAQQVEYPSELYETGNALGSMGYRVYAPPDLEGRVPLFVHIHGANIDTADVQNQSRLNELASERGFVVVYPQEDPGRNAGIWDHEAAAAEGRDGRATSLIAQITREVMAMYPIDARRVFVGGISAGSGVAIVMAAQYPDLYTGLQAEGGDRYGTPFEDENESGRMIFEAMGDRARRIPMMLSIGTLDPFGLTTNTNSVARHWLIAHDWMDDGAANDSIALTPAETRTGHDGKNYSVDTYVDSQGCVLVERWLIQGMFHAYAGGAPAAIYDVTTDANAPNMREVAYDFFLDQYDEDGPPGCRKSTMPMASGGGSIDIAGLPLLLLLLSLRQLLPRCMPRCALD